MYKGVSSELPELLALQVEDFYRGFSRTITTMDISTDVPLVDSAFGKVQEGKCAVLPLACKETPENPFTC